MDTNTITPAQPRLPSRAERRKCERRLRAMVTSLAREKDGRRHSGKLRGVHFEPGAEQGAPVLASPVRDVSHPLAVPTVSGTSITVDTMLQQPTRITRMIMDMSLQRFVADRVFANGGGVTGGAVIYDVVAANELYTNRDAERITPGSEFPIITSDRRVPNVAEVEKWGGKVWISDEARDRNDSSNLVIQIRQLTNTIVRKINARAIQELETSITANGRTATGRSWSDVVAVAAADVTAANARNMAPVRDFALANQMSETDELGISYDLWLLNPVDYTNLIVMYGADGLNDLLDAMDIDIYVSNRVTGGTAYAVAANQVGQMRVEKPLGTETWREPGRERTWIQASVRPLMFVDNPFAVIKWTGLQA